MQAIAQKEDSATTMVTFHAPPSPTPPAPTEKMPGFDAFLVLVALGASALRRRN
jgi:MYXO-CTERM domain-containing protein